MKRKILFLIAVFAATVGLMALQKPVFLAWYVAGQGFGAADWWRVVWHGLSLDLTVAGYITALPLLAVLLSLWVELPERIMRRAFTVYFSLISIVAAAIFAIDLGLYEHWGFRIDSTILIYLADPREAMASVDFWLGVRQTLLFAAYAALMIRVYLRIGQLFDGRPLGWRIALPCSFGMLLLAGFDFLAIRGGTGTSVANVSKVCFSSEMLLNHAAINPVFSFLSSLGDRTDYAAEYPFFDEETRAERFDALRGNRPDSAPDTRVLRTRRPNVVLILLESFARTIMDAEVDGEPVMPCMQRLREEGLWFENFFANSFRTDRGEVAIMSGFPAQTRISIMKLPTKSRDLPSLARSLGREGYDTRFVYGGDLNFTDQASYMYATGWRELFWQKDFAFDAPTSKWGYDDRVMCDWFGSEVIRWSAEAEKSGQPFLAGLLTLSSHAPFEVPYDRFEDRELNAMAFSDECVGRMIERWKASPAWDDLLVVLVADHGFPYPKMLAYNEPLRHRIPLIWTGGALAAPSRTVEAYASQIDLCATLLGQLGIAHDDFDYSKDIFDPAVPKFAYYAFNDGFGVVDASGEAIYDAATGQILSETAPGLADIGRTLLQTTYVDIGRR
ncbi:MAG: LTA synthase family protein [Alistipes sp.]|nr:LTA synthase family protein [Alistipes senegalensis]MCM1250791.1 LTA synthase family protein [Alistipes sp.]